MTNDSPKPLRPTLNEGSIFQFVHQETVVKGRTPMQAQRDKDGTPFTVGGRTALRPADPKLMLKGLSTPAEKPAVDKEAVLAKSVAVADAIVKSYMEQKGFTTLPIK